MCHPGFVDETLESLDPLTTQREARTRVSRRRASSRRCWRRIKLHWADIAQESLRSFCRIPKFNSPTHYLRHKARPTSSPRFDDDFDAREKAMTPQERQLIDDLFDRLAKLESAPRDPEAMSAIMQGLRKAPNARLCAGADRAGAGRSAEARRQPHPGTGSGERVSKINPAASSIRCATRSSGRTSARPVARFGAQRSRARDRRQPSGLEHGPGAAAEPAARTIQSAGLRPASMARSRRSSSRRSAAVAARFSAPRRRPRSAWSVARCWPAASAR